MLYLGVVKEGGILLGNNCGFFNGGVCLWKGGYYKNWCKFLVYYQNQLTGINRNGEDSCKNKTKNRYEEKYPGC